MADMNTHVHHNYDFGLQSLHAKDTMTEQVVKWPVKYAYCSEIDRWPAVIYTSVEDQVVCKPRAWGKTQFYMKTIRPHGVFLTLAFLLWLRSRQRNNFWGLPTQGSHTHILLRMTGDTPSKMTLASFTGLFRKKKACYWLFAHARKYPVKFTVKLRIKLMYRQRIV